MILSKPTIYFYPKEISNKNHVFSIIIPTWNNLEMLKFCIQSVLENSYFQHQIIIHVNEGSDGSLDWIKLQNYDYTYSETNAGVCFAVNAMATLASTNYILYLNDDMYVCKHWDKYLYDEIQLQSNELFYLSGTMIEPVLSSNKCAITPHDFGRLPTNFNKKELDNFAKNIIKEDWFGASWPPSVVHKKLWNKVQGYSEEFSPGMYSDPDFSMKLWQAGVRNFKGVGKCLVYHFMSHSTGRVVKNNGRKQFAKKWKIPSSFFYKNILLLGQKYNSKQQLKMSKNINYFIAKIRAYFISR